jgi:hypothetical protein
MLTACTQSAHASPSAGDLVGTWVHGTTALTLNADMSYELVRAPGYTAVGEGSRWRDGESPRRDETGQWTLTDTEVWLENDKLYLDYRGSELIVEWGLEFASDDPRCFQLVREGSSLDPLGPEQCYIRP